MECQLFYANVGIAPYSLYVLPHGPYLCVALNCVASRWLPTELWWVEFIKAGTHVTCTRHSHPGSLNNNWCWPSDLGEDFCWYSSQSADVYYLESSAEISESHLKCPLHWQPHSFVLYSLKQSFSSWHRCIPAAASSHTGWRDQVVLSCSNMWLLSGKSPFSGHYKCPCCNSSSSGHYIRNVPAAVVD